MAPQGVTLLSMKTYILKPTMTFAILTESAAALKGNDCAVQAIASTILPNAPKPKPQPKVLILPPRQPLPRPVIDPLKTML